MALKVSYNSLHNSNLRIWKGLAVTAITITARASWRKLRRHRRNSRYKWKF